MKKRNQKGDVMTKPIAKVRRSDSSLPKGKGVSNVQGKGRAILGKPFLKNYEKLKGYTDDELSSAMENA